MDENRTSGTVKNIGGKIEEGAGAAVGDAKTQLQGKLDQAAGTAQDFTAKLQIRLGRVRPDLING